MNGIQIEYLLGLYFLVVCVHTEGTPSRIVADLIKLVAAVVLIAMAVFGKSLI